MYIFHHAVAQHRGAADERGARKVVGREFRFLRNVHDGAYLQEVEIGLALADVHGVFQFHGPAHASAADAQQVGDNPREGEGIVFENVGKRHHAPPRTCAARREPLVFKAKRGKGVAQRFRVVGCCHGQVPDIIFRVRFGCLPEHGKVEGEKFLLSLAQHSAQFAQLQYVVRIGRAEAERLATVHDVRAQT